MADTHASVHTQSGLGKHSRAMQRYAAAGVHRQALRTASVVQRAYQVWGGRKERAATPGASPTSGGRRCLASSWTAAAHAAQPARQAGCYHKLRLVAGPSRKAPPTAACCAAGAPQFMRPVQCGAPQWQGSGSPSGSSSICNKKINGTRANGLLSALTRPAARRAGMHLCPQQH